MYLGLSQLGHQGWQQTGDLVCRGGDACGAHQQAVSKQFGVEGGLSRVLPSRATRPASNWRSCVRRQICMWHASTSSEGTTCG